MQCGRRTALTLDRILDAMRHLRPCGRHASPRWSSRLGRIRPQHRRAHELDGKRATQSFFVVVAFD